MFARSLVKNSLFPLPFSRSVSEGIFFSSLHSWTLFFWVTPLSALATGLSAFRSSTLGNCTGDPWQGLWSGIWSGQQRGQAWVLFWVATSILASRCLKPRHLGLRAKPEKAFCVVHFRRMRPMIF